MMNIGEKIKSARISKGYTQEELGKLIGVQKSAVAKYENGRIVNIKRSVLAKISKVLDIPPIELVSDIEEKPVETANRLFDYYLSMKFEEDKDVQMLIEHYQKLDQQKKDHLIQYARFLLGQD